MKYLSDLILIYSLIRVIKGGTTRDGSIPELHNFLWKNVLHRVFLFHSSSSRWLLCKVSYALSFSSYDWIDNITSWCYKSLGNKDKPYKLLVILISDWIKLLNECHNFTRSICHVHFVMFNPNPLCINSISFSCWLYSIITVIQLKLLSFHLEI